MFIYTINNLILLYMSLTNQEENMDLNLQQQLNETVEQPDKNTLPNQLDNPETNKIIQSEDQEPTIKEETISTSANNMNSLTEEKEPTIKEDVISTSANYVPPGATEEINIVPPTPSVESQEPSTKSTEEITLKVDKSTLTSLCQNLNSNLLVNIIAYKGILTKLKDSENNTDKKSELETNIENLEKILESVSSLMKNVQTNLDVPSDKIVIPEDVIKEALKTTTLADQLISAQVTTILASLAAAAVLAGGKLNKKKHTKRKHRYTKKQTKKHH